MNRGGEAHYDVCGMQSNARESLYSTTQLSGSGRVMRDLDHAPLSFQVAFELHDLKRHASFVAEGCMVNTFTWNTLTETMMSISSTLNQKILEFVLSAGHVTLAA
jgi:hypothetical protein